MIKLLKTMLMLSLFSSAYTFANLSSFGTNNVILSNDNTNHFICENGLINDVMVPKHIPHEINIIRENAFLVYKMKRTQQGIQYVEKSHTIHIVCNGEVYAINATQKNQTGKAIHLGSSEKADIEFNAAKLQQMSIEDVMVEMFLDAYNNNLPPNYTVKEEVGSIDSIEGITAKKRRSIALNGLGLRLLEFTVTSDQSLNLYKTMFMKKEFSKKMRLIGLVPEKVSKDAPARLFIIEDK